MKPEKVERDIKNIDKIIHKRAEELAKLTDEETKQHMRDQLGVLDTKRDNLLELLARLNSQ